MTANNQTNRRFWPWWRQGLTGLSLVGLALSGYLGWHYLMGGLVIGCAGGSSCDQVLNSRWSSVGGVLPVSGLAAGAYLAMLVAGFYIGPATEAPVRRLAWRAMLVLVGAAAGSAVWFVVVQRWMVKAFCPYCMATHITGLLLAGLVIWRASRPDDADTTAQRTVRLWSTLGWVVAGLAFAGALAVCQVVIKPPAVYHSGESQDNFPILEPRAVPLAGSPDAPYVVTLLFDYNCPHCQQLHLMLGEAIRRYGGKLAFALCPSPLNSRCNPYVPVDVDEFRTSCELARIALAVWVAQRDAFPAFDNWMFSFESGDRWQPRSPAAAKAKAIALVGQAKFDAAFADPWVAQYLQTCVRIYGNTVQSAGNSRRANAVPKLVFGLRWVIPEPEDADDLDLILRESLGVPQP